MPQLRIGALGILLCLTLTSCPPQIVACNLSESDWKQIESGHSVARVWNELALHAIRKDLPQPTVHSRNLYHLSAAMFDAWAVYDPAAKGVFTSEKQSAISQTARAEAIAYAAHRVLRQRYSISQGTTGILDCFSQGLRRAGLDPNNQSTTGNSPSAVGNRIGQAVLEAARNDGSNEANNYADTSSYSPVNDVLRPNNPGTRMTQPDHWQPLLLDQPFTQNGIPQSGPQKFIGPHWREVKPFAMQRKGRLYHDPGPAPAQASAQMRDQWVVDLIRKQSQLDVTSTEGMDGSPGVLGNNPLGTNNGTGHPLNPSTGKPYGANPVKRSDYWRVVAEYWADGPSSETPPGHWNVIANKVSDTPGFARKLGGVGETLSPLEWDVKVYLALNGALHDAAIAAWEIKRDTNTARPISLVRYMADVDPRGLPLIPGLIEQRNGAIQVPSWRPGRGVGWADAVYWMPYQLANFVSPAFPGFVSGHSTFSRAAAEVLSDLTGSSFFPGGLHEELIPAGSISIDNGYPNAEVKLQWATYYDAADQAGQSRIWGGIHIEPDDLAGRRIGKQIGLDAVALARKHFAGIAQ